MAGGGANDGFDPGEEIGSPVGSEAAGDLAIGGCGPQFALGAVVVGGDLGMLQEGEEVGADLGIAFS